MHMAVMAAEIITPHRNRDMPRVRWRTVRLRTLISITGIGIAVRPGWPGTMKYAQWMAAPQSVYTSMTAHIITVRIMEPDGAVGKTVSGVHRETIKTRLQPSGCNLVFEYRYHGQRAPRIKPKSVHVKSHFHKAVSS